MQAQRRLHEIFGNVKLIKHEHFELVSRLDKRYQTDISTYRLRSKSKDNAKVKTKNDKKQIQQITNVSYKKNNEENVTYRNLDF